MGSTTSWRGPKDLSPGSLFGVQMLNQSPSRLPTELSLHTGTSKPASRGSRPRADREAMPLLSAGVCRTHSQSCSSAGYGVGTTNIQARGAAALSNMRSVRSRARPGKGPPSHLPSSRTRSRSACERHSTTAHTQDPWKKLPRTYTQTNPMF